MSATIQKPNRGLLLQLVVLTLMITACSRSLVTPPRTESVGGSGSAELEMAPNPCDLALVPPFGEERIDGEIRDLQARVRKGQNKLQWLEKLGWKYVSKARASFDPGYYKLAEQCALCLESHQPHYPEALLLRGHVLQSVH